MKFAFKKQDGKNSRLCFQRATTRDVTENLKAMYLSLMGRWSWSSVLRRCIAIGIGRSIICVVKLLQGQGTCLICIYASCRPSFDESTSIPASLLLRCALRFWCKYSATYDRLWYFYFVIQRFWPETNLWEAKAQMFWNFCIFWFSDFEKLIQKAFRTTLSEYWFSGIIFWDYRQMARDFIRFCLRSHLCQCEFLRYL